MGFSSYLTFLAAMISSSFLELLLIYKSYTEAETRARAASYTVVL